MSDLKLLYNDLLNKENFYYDESQYNAVKTLNDLKIQILEAVPKNILPKFLRKLIINNHLKKNSFFHSGVYLHGGVGTGKTMIMNLFFQGLYISEKRRVHFHEFMHEFHQKTKKIRNDKLKDPIKRICDDIAKDIKVLCFDEFQIVDITDAMIVGRLFEELIKNGVIIITTSNFKIHELYKDGLNRKLFLPFINFIEKKFKILEVDSKVDYRKKKLRVQNRFFFGKKFGRFKRI
ncbi:MAG: cell division protein ZapE [Paracoccaceae bacterium]